MGSEMNQILEMQREAPVKLATLIAGKSEDALRRTPAPGKWSVVEVIAHMAEDELATSWRYRQMLEHIGTPLPGFDQDEWARRGQYAQWDLRDALEMFRLLRAAVSRLSDEDLERRAPGGREPIGRLLRGIAAHDLYHAGQIQLIKRLA